MSVIIDQFRISDDGKALFLNVHVNSAPTFDGLYINKITICTENQVSELDYLCYGDKYVWQNSYDSETREVNVVLCKEMFTEQFSGKDLSHNMFFVYIECGGTPSQDTPCALDGTTIAVTFDYDMVYNPAMNYTRELGKECEIPMNFLDFILNVEALKISVETEHWGKAVEHWKRLMGSVENTPYEITNCGCHH